MPKTIKVATPTDQTGVNYLTATTTLNGEGFLVEVVQIASAEVPGTVVSQAHSNVAVTLADGTTGPGKVILSVSSFATGVAGRRGARRGAMGGGSSLMGTAWRRHI